MSTEEGQEAITIVLEEIARRRISRRRLADEARISLSTLEKVLSGRRAFTLATLVRIEEALGVSLRRGNGTSAVKPVDGGEARLPGVAPDDLGSYARPSVTWIEGAYLTIRPSFGDQSAVYAYRTEIAWDEVQSLLTFRESERLDSDFTQWGTVAVPNQSGYIYLVTNRHGQHRLIVASRPTINGEMHGILTTLQVGRGSQLTPVAAPIVLVPLETLKEVHFGRIGPAHQAYVKYRALLKRTLDDEFAIFFSA